MAAGLRPDGSVAPLALDGPATGAASCARVEQAPAPGLAPGDAAVMDDPPAHKTAAASVGSPGATRGEERCRCHSATGMPRLVKGLNLSRQKPRPAHPGASRAAQERFKGGSPP